MARRLTPAEKMAELQELMALGYYELKERAKMQARRATAKERAEAAIQEKLEAARALLALPKDDLSALLQAQALLSKAQGAGETAGALEAAAAAGVTPAGVTAGPVVVQTPAPALPQKANSGKRTRKTNGKQANA